MLPAEEIAAYGAAGLGLVGSVAYLRRRLSRDRTEMVKDRVEGNFFELLLQERDAARRDSEHAMKLREEDARAIARLTAENERQAFEIGRLKTEFAAFKRLILRVRPDVAPFLGSDFMPMNYGDSPPPALP